MSETVKYLLEESRLPKEWYNIVADLPRPPDPVLHPGTLQPVGPADLEPLFPSALAFAGALFGLEVRVYMVRVSFDQKPYRKALMEAWGAQCVASPSEETNAGRQNLAEHPNSPGSLGIAISEAVEVAAQHADTKYALGSVLNH